MRNVLMILSILYDMIKDPFSKKKPLFNLQEKSPLPDKFHPAIKQYLGKRALDLQKSEEEPGVWYIDADRDPASISYAYLGGYLLDVRVTMPADQQRWLKEEMKTVDKSREAMVSFRKNDQNFIGRVNLADED